MKQFFVSRFRSSSKRGDGPTIQPMLYRGMMVFLGIAILVFFGRILQGMQPWYSLLLGGAGVLWTISYSRKLFSASRGLKGISPTIREHYLDQLMLSVTVIVVAVAVGIYSGPALRWVALTSFAIGSVFAMLFSPVSPFSRFLKYQVPFEPKTDQNVSASPQHHEKQIINPLEDAAVVQGIFFAGLAILVVFVSLTIWTAMTRGLNPIDTLLLVNFKGLRVDSSFFKTLGDFLSLENRQTLFAIGAIYGAAGIAYAMIVASVHQKGWLVLIVSSNGLLFGYGLTLLAAYLLGLTHRLFQISEVSFAYIFFINYANDFVLEYAPWRGMRQKYELLIGGVGKVATAWVLSRIFGEASIIFSGILFFACTFVTTTVCEILFTRLLGDILEEIPKSRFFNARELFNRPKPFTYAVALVGAAFPFITFFLMNAIAKGI